MTESTAISLIGQIDELTSGIESKFGTKPDERMGVRSGFSLFDQMTRGFHPGKLYIAGSRPAGGKTSFVTSIIANIAKFQKEAPVLLFSTELPEDEIIMQVIEAYSNGVPVYPNGRVSSQDEIDKLRAALHDVRHQLVSGFLKIIHMKRLTTTGIECEINRHCDKTLGRAGAFVIIDQASRIQRDDESRHGYAIATEHMLNRFEDMAGKQDLPLLLISQLNRMTELQKHATMANFKHSGAFEEFAHCAFLLEKDEGHGQRKQGSAYINNSATVHIAKNRHGRVGPVRFNFHGEAHHWTESTERMER